MPKDSFFAFFRQPLFHRLSKAQAAQAIGEQLRGIDTEILRQLTQDGVVDLGLRFLHHSPPNRSDLHRNGTRFPFGM